MSIYSHPFVNFPQTACHPAFSITTPMKKTPAKKTKTAVKAVAPVRKAAPPKKVAPATRAAPAIKKTPIAKKAAVKAAVLAPVYQTTTIVAAIDVGFGNTLTLRGEGPGLSWERGVPLECATGDLWTITLPGTSHPIVCKFLINDATWCIGDDYTVLPGSSVVLSPTF